MISKKLIYFRKEKGLSRYKLAILANVDDGLLSKIENNQVKDPKISTVNKLAKALDVKIDDLIDEGED
ncbi:helix-turn-helix domain-containing protein [Anaerorhabdus sp.]|uniref:helix-turn-helix domain-containing protein n=1 Tax=Anaerorhabdus sp. TaxID=1872524 RepID=UPI002FC6E2A2